MKLSTRKQLLKESELTLKSIKKSLNEGRIEVKGKMIQEPKQYVVRCHTKPGKWARDTGYGRNMQVGYYVMFKGAYGEPMGTNDINKAHVFIVNNYDDSEYEFPWDDAYTDTQGVEAMLGDYFEPVPVEVKRIVTIKK